MMVNKIVGIVNTMPTILFILLMYFYIQILHYIIISKYKFYKNIYQILLTFQNL